MPPRYQSKVPIVELIQFPPAWVPSNPSLDHIFQPWKIYYLWNFSSREFVLVSAGEPATSGETGSHNELWDPNCALFDVKLGIGLRAVGRYILIKQFNSQLKQTEGNHYENSFELDYHASIPESRFGWWCHSGDSTKTSLKPWTLGYEFSQIAMRRRSL